MSELVVLVFGDLVEVGEFARGDGGRSQNGDKLGQEIPLEGNGVPPQVHAKRGPGGHRHQKLRAYCLSHRFVDLVPPIDGRVLPSAILEDGSRSGQILFGGAGPPQESIHSVSIHALPAAVNV